VTWKVIFSEPFGDWWESLSREERISVGMYVDLLRTEGVTLRAPYSSGIQGSRYGHMRELRIQHKGHPYRVLYAFDPRRSAVLLLGGDKTGNDQLVRRKRTQGREDLRRAFEDAREQRGQVMARDFEELLAQMPEEDQQRVAAGAARLRVEMRLGEIRKGLRISQEALAEVLEMRQASISKIERQTDTRISTLRKIIEGMGGELDLIARFPEGAEIRINQFDREKSENGEGSKRLTDSGCYTAI